MFTLNQNYPNPFNPSTTIRYQLPVNSKVKLKIYNIHSEEVVVLVNSEQNAGYYQIIWKPNQNITSGVYFYRIEAIPLDGEAKSFVDTKKLIFIK